MAKKPKIEYLNRMNAAERRRIKEMSVKLQLLTEALTRRDLADWRRAWQMAINVDNPNRTRLLNLYTDVDADLHLTGCVQQRMGFVLNKSFKLCDVKGVENPELTELLEAPGSRNFCDWHWKAITTAIHSLNWATWWKWTDGWPTTGSA